MPVLAELSITLEEPQTIRCGDSVYRCGGITYLAIRHLVTSRKGASTVRAMCRVVWGATVGPEVSRVTVKGVIHRANDVLAGIGARERLTLDGEAILLV